jgi:hypothetical protein
LNNPLQKLIDAGRGEALTSKTANPVFVGGIKYPSLFDASYDSGIRSVSIWKAVKRQGGGPALIRGTLVVMESWVTGRTKNVKEYYQL